MTATYTFASRVQRGFTAQGDGRAAIQLTVQGKVPIDREVTMMGPADVVGIPPQQVIRTWPKAGVHNAEPNYLALVELDAPELPWLFSKPDPSDGSRVHPWLMLVVVEVRDGADPIKVASDDKVTVTISADQRPDPTQAWLWTHGQLLDSDTVPSDPARSLARLVCPRRLEANKRYVGCVVPTFRAGVRAAAGENLAPDDADRAQTTPGWSPGSGEVTLPVYYHWRFSTGPSGDFESLVRRLHGVPLPPGMGRRRLRLDHPLSGLPSAGVDDLELHVALRPPGESTAPLADLGVRADYVATLKQRLADADYDVSLLEGRTPVVGPPVHGQLPVGSAARASALGTDAVPPWLSDLNLDPRHRVAAGLAAEVVRRNQEHYMEEAWRQVGDVLEANRLRRRAEYSLGATRRLFDRWIARLEPADLVTVTAPVHAKVAVARQETVVGRLRDSPLPPAVASVELRRFARERGQLAQASDWQAALGVQAVAAVADQPEPLVQRVPLDSVVAFEPPSKVWGAELSKEILGRLVKDLGSVTVDEAATRLDAVSEIVPAVMPTVDQVRTQVATVQPDVDRTLSVIGLVPLATVTDVVRPDRPAPPDRPDPVHPFDPNDVRPGPIRPDPIRPGPIRPDPIRPGPLRPDPIRPGPIRPMGDDRRTDPIRPGPLRPDDVRPGPDGPVPDRPVVRDLDLDHLIRRDVNVLVPSLRGDEVIDTIREQPGLVTDVGGRTVIDTVTLDHATRVGEAVVKIDKGVFDKLVDGTFVKPEPSVVGFDLPAAEIGGIRTEIEGALATIAGLTLRPDDAIAKPLKVLTGGFGSLQETLVKALDPRATILAAVNSRIAALREEQQVVLDDIMAAPDLSEPTYQQLGAISHDWLLPGLDQLPTDTTTLVAANLEFIASFLVGMNHELARELLWREYPTDQRGTYARQFWTHVIREPDDRFDLKRLLHDPRRHSLRGLMSNSGEPEDPLVLVVKGELVQRYPGLIIVAATTEKKGHLRVPKGTPMVPDFVGVLEPDVLLAGFTELSADDVWAAERSGDDDKKWWFFFAEHFTEPRFGLDEDSTSATFSQWNGAAWTHLPDGNGPFLKRETFNGRSMVKGDEKPEKFTWGTDAAQQAWISLQFPFRRGIPAAELLPPEEP